MFGDSRTKHARMRSRELRRSATDAEGALWRRMRGRSVGGAKFRRQHPIGPYFVDFCCIEAMLIVELDGGQHSEQAERDARRTEFLKRMGFRVIRFWNHEVLKDPESVLAAIFEVVTEATAKP